MAASTVRWYYTKDSIRYSNSVSQRMQHSRQSQIELFQLVNDNIPRIRGFNSRSRFCAQHLNRLRIIQELSQAVSQIFRIVGSKRQARFSDRLQVLVDATDDNAPSAGHGTHQRGRVALHQRRLDVNQRIGKE